MTPALLAILLLLPYTIGAVATATIVTTDEDSKTFGRLLIRSLAIVLIWWVIIGAGMIAALREVLRQERS
jgi:hypothetical protein